MVKLTKLPHGPLVARALERIGGTGMNVDDLAQEIRRVDGNHSLGAGQLAEALMPFILASAPVAVKTPLSKRIAMARGHLMNIEAYGNAEANGVLVIRNVLSEVEAALSAIEPQEGWRLVPDGAPVPLDECPVGLFLCGETLALKTEYGNNEGRIDAYIVSSGEFFWGTAPQTIQSQRAQIVQPLAPLPTPPAGRAEG